MFNATQARTLSVQSSAIVLAALITTCGVVISACIQTGWISKPSSVVSVLPQPPPKTARAFFTGSVQPIQERPPSFVEHASYIVGKGQKAELVPSSVPFDGNSAPMQAVKMDGMSAQPSLYLDGNAACNPRTDLFPTTKKLIDWQPLRLSP